MIHIWCNNDILDRLRLIAWLHLMYDAYDENVGNIDSHSHTLSSTEFNSINTPSNGNCVLLMKIYQIKLTKFTFQI